ncbi:MAG TPA: hypothetical protein VF326_05440 [Anaerolineaceae bacterium]
MQNTFMKNRDFRFLWAGPGLSVLGDQFEPIAPPLSRISVRPTIFKRENQSYRARTSWIFSLFPCWLAV